MNLFCISHQHWEYDKSSNRIQHIGSGKCLDSRDHKEEGLVLNSCSDSFSRGVLPYESDGDARRKIRIKWQCL